MTQTLEERRAYYAKRRQDPVVRERMKEYQRAWREKNPRRPHESIWYRYGITWDDIRDMLEAQGGCAICGITDVEKWCVDHDHDCCPGGKSCGKCIRGILCDSCNRGIGQFGDCADTMRAAAEYLERRKEI